MWSMNLGALLILIARALCATSMTLTALGGANMKLTVHYHSTGPIYLYLG